MNLVPYETGRFYKVPCVFGAYFGRDGWWPTLGDFHNDKAIIGFDYWHWHIDVRFLAARVYKRLAGGQLPDCSQRFARSAPLLGFSSLECPVGRVPGRYVRRDFTHFAPQNKPTTVVKRLLCRREWEPCESLMSKASWIAALEAAYGGQRLAGGHCPHRGADLRSLQPGPDGIVECPLHGLRWRLSDGRLVPRAAKQEAL